jgi:hypothetical protein
LLASVWQETKVRGVENEQPCDRNRAKTDMMANDLFDSNGIVANATPNEIKRARFHKAEKFQLFQVVL